MLHDDCGRALAVDRVADRGAKRARHRRDGYRRKGAASRPRATHLRVTRWAVNGSSRASRQTPVFLADEHVADDHTRPATRGKRASRRRSHSPPAATSRTIELVRRSDRHISGRPIAAAYDRISPRALAGAPWGRHELGAASGRAAAAGGSTAGQHHRPKRAHRALVDTRGPWTCSEAETGCALSSSVGLRATPAKTCSASMRPSPFTRAAAASGESSSRSTIARDSHRTASWACSTSAGGSRVRRAAVRSGSAMS